MHELPTIASSTYATAAVDLANFRNAAIGQVLNQANAAVAQQRIPNLIQLENHNMPARRLVQVFIADPNENIPLEKSLLYSGEQKLTDATDQELFFEVDIKNILETHNAERTKIVDKKVKDRTEYLEPAKIRDLKMVVVTVASF